TANERRAASLRSGLPAAAAAAAAVTATAGGAGTRGDRNRQTTAGGATDVTREAEHGCSSLSVDPPKVYGAHAGPDADLASARKLTMHIHERQGLPAPVTVTALPRAKKPDQTLRTPRPARYPLWSSYI